MHFLHYCQIPGNDRCSRLITQTVVKILFKLEEIYQRCVCDIFARQQGRVCPF